MNAQVHHYSNVTNQTSVMEGHQVLAFGNSGVEVPLTKVKKGRNMFAEIVDAHNGVEQKEFLEEQLLNLLKLKDK